MPDLTEKDTMQRARNVAVVNEQPLRLHMGIQRTDTLGPDAFQAQTTLLRYLPCVHIQSAQSTWLRRYHTDRHAIIVQVISQQSNGIQATAFAFLPRTLFGGVGFGSFCVAMRAETRARVAWLGQVS